MGGGSWTPSAWSSFRDTNVTSKKSVAGQEGVYAAKTMSHKWSPLNVTRESRDNSEHPLSTPIILGLDVTGSMASMLQIMAEKLGVLVGEIYKRNPITDPQILFAAVGDAICDDYPLQVTQFESDIRVAKQLTELYFEKGGGGNGFESYPLVWYFASKHTSCDAIEKREKKGFIFTFGDDGYPSELTRGEIKKIFGEDPERNISVDEILTEVNRKFEVYHFCMAQGGSHKDSDHAKWQKILGERAIKVTDSSRIPEMIVSILEMYGGKSKEEILQSWDGTTALAVESAIKGLNVVGSKTGELVEFSED